MATNVRLARASDVADIARLTAQLGYEVGTSVLGRRLSSILGRPDHRFLIAEVEAHPVGWLHAAICEHVETDPFVLIGGLVVDRSFRGRGIGRILMASAEDWARVRGRPIVRLWSSAARTDAHRFYERLGYRKIKTQHSFAKSLDPAGRDELSRLVPRLEE